MEKVAEGAIWNIIRNGDEIELERRYRRRMQIKTDQEIQGDWYKIENSLFCRDYKYMKDNIGIKKYWQKRNQSKGNLGEKDIWKC